MFELNIILSLTKCEVCVLQNYHVCACGWRCCMRPQKKVWPLLINPLPHPVFSLFTVSLNKVGPLPLVFSLLLHDCRAYKTNVSFKKQKAVCWFGKPQPHMGGGIANLGSVKSRVWRDFGTPPKRQAAFYFVINLHKLLFVLSA